MVSLLRRGLEQTCKAPFPRMVLEPYLSLGRFATAPQVPFPKLGQILVESLKACWRHLERSPHFIVAEPDDHHAASVLGYISLIDITDRLRPLDHRLLPPI